MEKALVDYINTQRKEAEEFNKISGNYMGMMPEASDTEYWNERVPSGTLRELQRTQLEEAAYYAAAGAMSKSYARFISSRMSEMSDKELDDFIGEMCKLIELDRVA